MQSPVGAFENRPRFRPASEASESRRGSSPSSPRTRGSPRSPSRRWKRPPHGTPALPAGFRRLDARHYRRAILLLGTAGELMNNAVGHRLVSLQSTMDSAGPCAPNRRPYIKTDETAIGGNSQRSPPNSKQRHRVVPSDHSFSLSVPAGRREPRDLFDDQPTGTTRSDWRPSALADESRAGRGLTKSSAWSATQGGAGGTAQLGKQVVGSPRRRLLLPDAAAPSSLLLVDQPSSPVACSSALRGYLSEHGYRTGRQVKSRR